MTIVCLLALAFVAYKLLQEEHVLLKSGNGISARQWQSFRMAKMAIRNLVIFVTAAMLFIDGTPLIYLLAAELSAYLVIQFGARIFYRIRQ